MTGLKKVRSLSQKGKTASVNYSVDTSVMVPRQTVSVVIKTAMKKKKKRKLTQASLRKRFMQKNS